MPGVIAGVWGLARVFSLHPVPPVQLVDACWHRFGVRCRAACLLCARTGGGSNPLRHPLDTSWWGQLSPRGAYRCLVRGFVCVVVIGSYVVAFRVHGMAAHSKSHDEHTANGSWRADRHGGLVDVRGVPGVEHDSVLWNQLEQWQRRFDDAAEDVATNGTTLDSRGQVVQNPAAKMMKDASSEIRELCKILGIGPLNRSRLGAAPDEGDESNPDDAPARKRG